eukprot:779350-Rhodomonas_salina.1
MDSHCLTRPCTHITGQMLLDAQSSQHGSAGHSALSPSANSRSGRVHKQKYPRDPSLDLTRATTAGSGFSVT